MIGHPRLGPLALLLLGLVGCTDESVPVPLLPPAGPAPPAGGAAFDPAGCGTIAGRVRWDGPTPMVEPFRVFHAPDNPAPGGKLLTYEDNPFRPQIDPAGGGVRDVVVVLRGVDPGRARPWPHGPAQVEIAGRRIRVVQDGAAGRVGFVRRGDAVEVVNRDPEYHSLRARGAAFFCLPLPTPDRPTRRRLDQTGVVSIFSGAAYYWMHAHLLVDDQPYQARTDAEGRFRIEQVPAGRYEAVCWMPRWDVARTEREPESAWPTRLVFAPPAEQRTTVPVAAGQTGVLDFTWSDAQLRSR